MAKIKLVKWRGDNGQLAISFPAQPLKSQPSPIVRQAHVAATQATEMIVQHWFTTIASKIDQPIGVSYHQHRINVGARHLHYEERAYRRYLKLFKAWGMK